MACTYSIYITILELQALVQATIFYSCTIYTLLYGYGYRLRALLVTLTNYFLLES